MKLKFLLVTLFLIAFNARAEMCAANIKDYYGNILEHFTADSYNRDAACSEAMYQCNRSLSDARSNGRYYDANCEVEPIYYPNPNPFPTTMCQTDLVDQWGRLVRTFSASGRNEYEACNQSEQFCKEELYRNTSYGMRCITRNGRNPNPNPYPPRQRTETCTANRFDPAGMFIQSYFASASGPINLDVKAMACENAMRNCQSELRGRQFCNIGR